MAKIGLVAVDGKKFPNLALGKIATYYKQRGDLVEWADPMFGEYDKVFISKIFSFTPDNNNIYDAKEIIKGGTGYSITSVLPKEIDRLQPDYSLWSNIDDNTAYGFLTRGCPNKCKWCVVPEKEGGIHPYMDIDEITQGGKRNRVILMDNNILACDYGIEQLEKIAEKRYIIDLNQASDARLITDDIAKIYGKIRWIKEIRFGCDTPAQIGECEKAMAMIDKHRNISAWYILYTMIHGDINECYERLSYFRNYHKVRVFAQPFRDIHNPKQVIPQWQKDMATWSMVREFWTTVDFKDFEPRKGFKCGEYLK